MGPEHVAKVVDGPVAAQEVVARGDGLADILHGHTDGAVAAGADGTHAAGGAVAGLLARGDGVTGSRARDTGDKRAVLVANADAARAAAVAVGEVRAATRVERSAAGRGGVGGRGRRGSGRCRGAGERRGGCECVGDGVCQRVGLRRKGGARDGARGQLRGRGQGGRDGLGRVAQRAVDDKEARVGYNVVRKASGDTADVGGASGQDKR